MGEPLCVLEVTAVEIKSFNAVDEQFAFAYGEGERTLADWGQDNYQAELYGVLLKLYNLNFTLLAVRRTTATQASPD